MANTDWRRIAVKQLDGQRVDILLALANVGRTANDKLSLYAYLGELIKREWQAAKERGMVSDAMLGMSDDVDLHASFTAQAS